MEKVVSRRNGLLGCCCCHRPNLRKYGTKRMKLAEIKLYSGMIPTNCSTHKTYSLLRPVKI